MNTTEAETTPKEFIKESCLGCGLEGKLLCIHTNKELADFWILTLNFLIPFLAGMILGKFWTGLIVWGALVFVFFGYIEQLLLCRHCPHYGEEGFILSCHANSGLPKIPRFSPRAMTRLEQIIWLIFVGVLFLFYLPFFIISGQWLLLGITSMGLLPSSRPTRGPNAASAS